jgi:sulfur-oxidizing protein SoxY
MRRREFMKTGSAVLSALMAAGFLSFEEAHAEAWNKAAFEAKSLEDLIRVLGGSGAQESALVGIDAPEIAENGAVVPVAVSSELGGTQAIAVVIEKNPNVVAAIFSIPDGTLPEVQTRVKMAQTSNLFAIVKADGKFHYAAKEIKVTLGGCGG